MGQIQLSDRQSSFNFYLVHQGKGRTEAARLAGFTAPRQSAFYLTQSPKIIAKIRQERNKVYQTELASTAVQTLKEVMESNSSNTFSWTSSNLCWGTRRKCVFSSSSRVFWSICFLVSETSPIEETGIMIVSGRFDWPNKGEERRKIEKRMSIYFTWFPFSELGEPNI